MNNLLILLLGSRGPSTVTLMAFWYIATCGGWVNTTMVKVKLFPEKKYHHYSIHSKQKW